MNQAMKVTEILNVLISLLRTKKRTTKEIEIKEINERIKRQRQMMKERNLTVMMTRTKHLCYIS